MAGKKAPDVFHYAGQFVDQHSNVYRIEENRNKTRYRVRINDGKPQYAGTYGKAWSHIRYMSRINHKTQRSPDDSRQLELA